MNRIKSLFKVDNNNIVRVFFIRAIFSLILISIVSTIAIVNLLEYRFYRTMADDIKLNVDKRLYKYDKDLCASKKVALEEEIAEMMEQSNLLIIKLYDNKKKRFLEQTSKKEDLADKVEILLSEEQRVQNLLQKSESMDYKFFKILDSFYFMKIYFPIYKSNILLAEIEAVTYIDPTDITKLKQNIARTIVTVFLSVVIFSLIIFPLIYFAYIELNRHKKELISSNIMTINTLGNAIALRDSDTNEHNYRVTLYGIKFAQSIDLDKESIKVLIKGAFLHDVGKIGISDNILLKNDKLDDEEFEIMKTHVLKGVELVDDDKWLEDAKEVILYHHEKYDGSGYPNGVKGEDIPLVARIFAIVDVFDALTSKRPYKEAFSYEKSIEILRESHNTHFDGELLSRFVKISKDLYLNSRLKEKEELREDLEAIIKRYFLA